MLRALAAETARPHGAFLALAAAAAFAGVAFTVVVFRVTRPRRPATGRRSPDLGPEPPAVVGFLVNRMVVPSEALAATVLDLAARRWFTIEPELGSTVMRTRQGEGRGTLAPYEARVLDHIRSLAVDGSVPASALATGPGDAPKRWRRAFVREVVADAAARGLCRPRWPQTAGLVVACAEGAIGGFLALAAVAGEPGNADWSSHPGFVAIAVVGLGLLGVLNHFWASDAQRDTPDGLRSASRWLGTRAALAANEDFPAKPASSVTVWGRHLAYAAAMGLAARATEDVPLGGRDDRRAWSCVGGRWRQVRVVYPRLRPGWGRAPYRAMVLGILVAAPAAALGWRCLDVARSYLLLLGADTATTAANTAIGWAALATALPLAVVAAWWLAAFGGGMWDLGRAREIRGEVLRKRVLRPREWLPERAQDALYVDLGDDRRSVWYFLAIDTGEGDQILAVRAARPIAQAVSEGDAVLVRVSPWLRFVRSAEHLPEIRAYAALAESV